MNEQLEFQTDSYNLIKYCLFVHFYVYILKKQQSSSLR